MIRTCVPSSTHANLAPIAYDPAIHYSRRLGRPRLSLRVEPATPDQAQWITQHFGARRFAYNWALAQIRANLDARVADPSIALLAWDRYQLHKLWNRAKQQVAPWWRECSKEAYASGIADLATALRNWSDSKKGRRAGARVGFPRFKTLRRDRGRIRFTTGPIRLEADRRHLVLPRIGRLRSKENTRRLQRLLGKGRARVLSMPCRSKADVSMSRCWRSSSSPPACPASQLPDAEWISASVRSGRSSPTMTGRSSGSHVPLRGRLTESVAVGSPDSDHAASSARGATARRTPSWRHSTDMRSTSARIRPTR